MPKHKLLIVDDHIDMRRLLRLTLGRRYDIIEAADGPGAWEAIRQYRPSGVVLDVMMPGDMDGFQLCEKIRQDPSLKDTYVVLVTARGQAADKAYGKEIGVDEYIVKPYSPLQLLDTISKRLK